MAGPVAAARAASPRNWLTGAGIFSSALLVLVAVWIIASDFMSNPTSMKFAKEGGPGPNNTFASNEDSVVKGAETNEPVRIEFVNQPGTGFLNPAGTGNGLVEWLQKNTAGDGGSLYTSYEPGDQTAEVQVNTPRPSLDSLDVRAMMPTIADQAIALPIDENGRITRERWDTWFAAVKSLDEAIQREGSMAVLDAASQLATYGESKELDYADAANALEEEPAPTEAAPPE
jgi:hypothetical protein